MGGVKYAPSILVVFFDDDKVHVIRAEGEEEVKLGLRTGVIERKIKEFIDRRIKLKAVEHLAEQFAGILLASEAERRRHNARAEYEEKLKKEREEMQQREEKRKKEEEQRKQEEERRRKLEEERRRQQEEERRRRLEEEKRRESERRAKEEAEKKERERKRRQVAEDLNKMDLSTAKIRDIKDKMEEAGIGYIGLTSREELIRRLKENFPNLQQTPVITITVIAIITITIITIIIITIVK